MSYERGRRNAEIGNARSATDQALGPGKVTLTERLPQPEPRPGVTPAGRRTPMVRDISSMSSVVSGGVTVGNDAGNDAGNDSELQSLAPSGAGGGATFDPPIGGDFAATVVGSAADTELARDGAFTPALLAALQDNPGLTIDQALRQVSATPIGAGPDNARGLHHPTILQYGQRAQGPSQDREHKKRAVLVGNQHYASLGPLYEPIDEVSAMRGELASRGYDASAHTDKTAPEMGALWTTMVGAAERGDDLVAFYSGHGTPEGLVGIQHAQPPHPPDLFTNPQVSGVVSSATGKGAHIRFVMDSCHSGAATQTVREVRENELAAAAGAAGDPLRVAALTGLHDLRQTLLAHCRQRDTAGSALAQRGTRAPVAGKLPAARDIEPAAEVPDAFDRVAAQIWDAAVPQLDIVRMAVGHRQPPPPITDYRTLGAQLAYLDSLWNTVAQRIERSEAGAASPEKPAR